MCSDSAKVWYPQRNVCRVSMERAAAQRRYDELHAERPYHDGTFTHWSAEATSATPYHAMDGVDIYVSEVDVNPDDAFLTAPDPFADRHDSSGGGPDGGAS